MMRARIGSKPPRCETRCRFCGHCEAIQVPTNPRALNGNNINLSTVATISYDRRQDNSNYKPMSWKCKCGNIIFNPWLHFFHNVVYLYMNIVSNYFSSFMFHVILALITRHWWEVVNDMIWYMNCMAKLFPMPLKFSLLFLPKPCYGSKLL